MLTHRPACCPRAGSAPLARDCRARWRRRRIVTRRHPPPRPLKSPWSPTAAGRDLQHASICSGRVQFYADDAHLAATAPAGATAPRRLAQPIAGCGWRCREAAPTAAASLVLEPLVTGADESRRRDGGGLRAPALDDAGALGTGPARQRILAARRRRRSSTAVRRRMRAVALAASLASK